MRAIDRDSGGCGRRTAETEPVATAHKVDILPS